MTVTSEHTSGYFHRLRQNAPTEFWINNATFAEAEAALAAGALGATTNPTYLARLLTEEPAYVANLIEEASGETMNNDLILDAVYQKAMARLQRLFLPLFERTHGRHGYVAIQGDPKLNSDSNAIVESAIRYRKLGENIIVKLPAWPAGARALEQMVDLGIPTIATLGFSVDQAVYMAETYRRALKKSKKRPICYVTFIAGVLDSYLAKVSAERGDVVPAEALSHAGTEGSRAAYQIYKSRNYEAILLGGGARGPHHFTELVGGDLAITIGWALARQIIESDAPIIHRIDASVPRSLVAELEARLPEFRASYREDSLLPDAFRDFGPVASFQTLFLDANAAVLNAISSKRGSMESGAARR